MSVNKAFGGNNASPMDSQTLLTLGIIRETAANVSMQNKINVKEKKILRIWQVIIETVVVLLLLLALKLVSFVSIQQHNYADFIAFVNQQRTLHGYSGPSGLMTALALRSPLFSMFFSNRLVPYALFYSWQTPEILALYSTTGCATLMQAIYNEGATKSHTTALDILCAGVGICAPGSAAPGSGICANPCTTSAPGNLGTSWQYFQGISGQAINGTMAGHVMGTALKETITGAENWGLGIGLAAGVVLGAITTALQISNDKQLCQKGSCANCS